MANRVFLVVLDGLGVGASPDAKDFGDSEFCNTLKSVLKSSYCEIPTLEKLGLLDIEQDHHIKKTASSPIGAFGRLMERSRGKDTIAGHWELCGIISKTSMPTYPKGFPAELICEFEKLTGRKVICNRPYSGTKLLIDFGEQHQKTGALLVYTSSDSVFQIAAHEDVVPLSELYHYCEIARELLRGEHSVGRVIARPFAGEYPNFVRTFGRKDFSLAPSGDTLLNILQANKKEVITIGKVNDIFAGSGCGRILKSSTDQEGMNKLIEIQKEDFNGLCFLNLGAFDTLYGHRRDIDGYAKALSELDKFLGRFMKGLRPDDLMIITADHGCDPGCLVHTDHTREYVPVLAYGPKVKPAVNIGTRSTFADVSATVLEYLRIAVTLSGYSFWPLIKIEEEK